jgi:hypothetical protein
MTKVQEVVILVDILGEYKYGLGGFSYSCDIILATLQLGGNLLRIIKAP